MWSESFDPLDDVKERNVGRSRQARKGKKKRATRSSVAIGQWVFHINCWMNGIAEKTKVSTRNGTFEGRNFLDQLDSPHIITAVLFHPGIKSEISISFFF